MNFNVIGFVTVLTLFLFICIVGCTTHDVSEIPITYQAFSDPVHKPYNLNTGMETRTGP